MTGTDRAFGLTDPSLAVGLTDVAFFTSEQPFINLINQVGGFQNFDGGTVLNTTDSNGAFVQKDFSQLFQNGFLDENGYIQTIPEGSSALLSIQAGIPAEANVGGRYVFLFEGEGDFSFFGGDVIEEESEPGRYVIEINNEGLGFGLNINSVEEGNHLRDLVLVREENEALYEAGAIFNPDFIEILEDVRVLRFMDWFGTNNSNISNFSDLATSDFAFYGIPANQARETEIAGNLGVGDAELATLSRGFVTPVFTDPITGEALRDPVTNELVVALGDGVNVDPPVTPSGVPLEVMVALANQIGADPWFNIPHFATDDFVREFAEYVRDNVDPELQIHIEYSNEAWNSNFDQFHFTNDRGLEEFGDEFGDFPFSIYYGYRSAEILSIFTEVFGEQADDRLVGVLGTQTVVTFRSQEVIQGAELFFERNDPDTQLDDVIDALGVTGYFGDVISDNSIFSESFLNLIDISRDAFANGETSDEFEFFNNALEQYYRDGTLFPGAVPELEGILNFNLEFFQSTITAQIGVINGNDFLGNPTRTPYDLDLIQYEGGSNITPITNDPVLFEFITQFNRSEQLARLQGEALDIFREEGGTLANDFQLIDAPRFANTFGTLAFPGDSNPVFDEFIDFNENAAAQFGSVEPGRDGSAFQQGITQFGTSANDTIFGTLQEDFLIGGIGEDSLVGGDANDGLNGEEGNDVLEGGDGADTLVGGLGNDFLRGDNGNDILIGEENSDNILGGGGDDIIDGGTGGDALAGGSGNDSIEGGTGDDDLFGSSGEDTLSGGDGADELSGGADDDLLTGGSGNDELFGEGDNDVILGGLGNDIISGGAGDDAVAGGSGNDFVFGDDGNDSLFGAFGDDQINAGLGNDAVEGGDGNDLINGEDGNDQLLGDNGFNTLFGGTGSDEINGGQNSDLLFGQAGNDLILGANGADRISGNSGFDTIFGGNGDDIINGNFNADRLFGQAGNDLIRGGDGSDRLTGNAGFDTLEGGNGNDILSGNFNADTFVFADGFGEDIITDFNVANAFEVIDLSAVTSITSFADLQNNHLTVNGDGDAVIVDGANSITLQGVTSLQLSAGDFVF